MPERDPVDVTELRELLAMAARARRRQRIIATVKFLFVAAIIVGLGALTAFILKRT